ncbi:MAG: hypothetical protein LBB60_10940 [Desulfovibrio sp.]|jgi:hypothetical protein|nr:hypothetical protein [Desulfovibrio sp.]
MPRKKSGLGKMDVPDKPEDLLDSVFGVKTPQVEKADSPSPEKKERVGKYFLLDRALAKSLKLYAVQHDLKEITVIEASLRAFLAKAD